MAWIISYNGGEGYQECALESKESVKRTISLISNCAMILNVEKEDDSGMRTPYNFDLTRINSQSLSVDKSKLIQELF